MSVAGGLLLGAAWIPALTILAFIAFIPFFKLEEIVLNSEFKKKRRSLFWFAWLTFFVWNLCDTWWICYASIGGASLAIIANSLIMAFVYWLYLVCTKHIKSSFKILFFIPFWISFEYFHTDWDLSWTWLTLGNVFAFKTNWVQWYEFTGVSGGSLWILIVNFIGYRTLIVFKNSSVIQKGLLAISFLLLIFIPIQLSNFVLRKYISFSENQEKLKPKTQVNVLVVQPAIDAYIEKFRVPFAIQFNEMLNLVSEKIDSSTDYLILPETFIVSQKNDDEISENNLEGQPYIQMFIDSFLKKYPQLCIVTGADTYYTYAPNEPQLSTSRKYQGANLYFECFNTAIQLRKDKPINLYHKSKLVPGVEMLPFPKVLGLLEPLALNMGGTTGSLGVQKEREVFEGPRGAKVGPIICFESAFGEFVTEYIKKGANVLFILTNDGWWNDSPGHKQHLAYACLRAIETRRYIARSANTGISCIIDDKGQTHECTNWFEKKVVKYKIPLIEFNTFFVNNGDFIARTLRLVVLATFIFCAYFYLNPRKKQKKST